MELFSTTHAEPREVSDNPRYRVNIWDRPDAVYAWNLDAYVICDADDVEGALRWALARAAGRPYELFVEVDDEPVREVSAPRTSALIRLAGGNPNAAGERFEEDPSGQPDGPE